MDSDSVSCQRRGCDAAAVFVVRERYPEETGKGIVEATAHLCHPHTAEESPTNLDPETPEYRFEVMPITASDLES